jgi:hypothetical protein
MCRLHPTRASLHAKAHRARTCKHVKHTQVGRLRLLFERDDFREARLQRICTRLAPDTCILFEPHALIPRRGPELLEAVAVVEVRRSEGRPEVQIKDQIVMQDIALLEQVLDRRLLKLVREEQMALPSITQKKRYVDR